MSTSPLVVVDEPTGLCNFSHPPFFLSNHLQIDRCGTLFQQYEPLEVNLHKATVSSERVFCLNTHNSTRGIQNIEFTDIDSTITQVSLKINGNVIWSTVPLTSNDARVRHISVPYWRGESILCVPALDFGRVEIEVCGVGSICVHWQEVESKSNRVQELQDLLRITPFKQWLFYDSSKDCDVYLMYRDGVAVLNINN